MNCCVSWAAFNTQNFVPKSCYAEKSYSCFSGRAEDESQPLPHQNVALHL